MGTAGPLAVLKRRADFVAASAALRAGTPALGLQARPRGDDGPLRVGFTCSRKVGGAVARNRAKRRLRAAARAVLPREGRAGWDYVLIGRPEETAARPFADLLSDLSALLARLHARADAAARPAPPPPREDAA
ncbi:ribonuclease P protein component [Rubellimicrobium sp. CFH 75288]|uniref:ribonuclease P protein component n=1 Tax=Rubellimicrobium sp. CFH 75288 TaxID=2697034 RepID=UPI001412DA57|nr:ribonuclease P protein component [Rubellimicrobium sp. CFH 75288]NAZ35877.1 ribonuclease P protein component [Rubellimicrobium sp. CFH 75288]